MKELKEFNEGLRYLMSSITISLWDAVEVIDDAVMDGKPAGEIADMIIAAARLFGKKIKEMIPDFDPRQAIPNVISVIEENLPRLPQGYEDVVKEIKERLGL